MELDKIVAELKTERERLSRAISALEGTDMRAPTAPAARAARARGVTRKRGRMSAAGRRRLSELMKQRWAERRSKKGSSR